MSILCYHEVDPDWQSTLAVDPADFDAHCRWLATRTVVPLDEAAPVVADRGRLPRGVSAITFDDGFPGVGAHAWPVLRRYGLPATTFVVARSVLGDLAVDWVDTEAPGARQTLTGDEIRALAADGMTIGSHSFAHADLTTLSEAEAVADLRESRQVLEELVGGPVHHLAYPRGRHNAMVRRAAERAGYQWAYALPETTEVGGQWAIPRVGVYPGNTTLGLRLKSQPHYATLRTSPIGPRLRDGVRATRRAWRTRWGGA